MMPEVLVLACLHIREKEVCALSTLPAVTSDISYCFLFACHVSSTMTILYNRQLCKSELFIF